MSTYIIQGGKKLEGEVTISGSKNAALPIIAASILNAGKTTLYNLPDIHDTQMMFEILKSICNFCGKFIRKTPSMHLLLSRGLRYLIDTSDKHKINEWIRELE